MKRNMPEIVQRRLPGMLMVGAAGRNVGKTELACALIRQFSKTFNVTGVKVTPVRERGGRCPRGGKGCGVCDSLSEDFVLTEETDGERGKDTVRMLDAGADRVLWLRVLKECLYEGMEALQQEIGPGNLSVCESNSLRMVAEPDLFLMVKDAQSQDFKRSARTVKSCVDRMVVFDQGELDFRTGCLAVLNGRWVLKAGR